MDEYYESLKNALEETQRSYDFEKIKSAYDYASALHAGQTRLSGEPYICHPVAVAIIVISLGLDTDSVCAALLHDTVEDCSDKTNLDEIKNRFGTSVSELVDGLTKIQLLKVEDKQEQQFENLRKMLLAMNKDIRVIFIKLCDRLHNMRTLEFKKEARQREIALETMHVYAPIAHRLGIQKIKLELENLSLKYLDPVGYQDISKRVEEKYGSSSSLMENAKHKIEQLLQNANIPYDIESRTKSVYSLYRKVFYMGKSFDEIYDFYALRIIVNTELECYTVLGLIHEAFSSMPGRFKDYISTPKPNLYRSLHTTVMGHEGIPFEVQIRTHEMHEIAEYGIAAHWKYKSGETTAESIDEKLRWIASLLENTQQGQDPDEFMESFKTDIFHDETFVFTPKGDVISLTAGATVIDFAYAIHSAVGNRMIGAKINGKIVTIDSVPQNGDIIEILTQQNGKGPSRDWLKIVKTSQARNKIRNWFKKEKRDENIVLGKELFDQEAKRFNRELTDKQREELALAVSKDSGIFTGIEDFYSALGYGGITITRISKFIRDEVNKIAPIQQVEQPVTQESIIEQNVKASKRVKRTSGIVVDGKTGCEVKFAKCCNPLPGDSVVGFITKGFGISIHKSLCPNVIAAKKDVSQLDRWVEAHWELGDNDAGADLYEAILSLQVQNRIGVLAKITALLADMRVSILDLSVRNSDQDNGWIQLSIGCKNVSHLEMIISKIRTIDNVLSVSRGTKQS